MGGIRIQAVFGSILRRADVVPTGATSKRRRYGTCGRITWSPESILAAGADCHAEAKREQSPWT